MAESRRRRARMSMGRDRLSTHDSTHALAPTAPPSAFSAHTGDIPVHDGRIPHRRIVGHMNTTKITNRLSPVAAILLGSAIAVVPITAHASVQSGTAPAFSILRSGPDIAISASGNLRQAIEADRAPAVVADVSGPTLRQQIEGDRGADVSPRTADPTVRQLVEADRG
jgi:hypothetical protein